MWMLPLGSTQRATLNLILNRNRTKMKRIAHILLVSILILTGCKDNSSYTPESGLSENHPIEFGVSGDLSVESKAPINSSTDAGFFVFGDLTVGDSDPVSVFGESGAEVTYAGGSWAYSPVRYWQLGSYSFGGVMPSGDFYTASFSSSDQTITLDFGKALGYDLAEHQADLMAAFDAVDVQSLSNPAPVDFDFDHQLACVVIEAASRNTALSDDGLQISELKIYGNSPSTEGNIVFTNNAGEVSVTQTLSAEKTNSGNPYKTLTDGWQLVKPGADGTPVYATLVPQLLVFPEECTFYIEVKYTEKGIEKTRVGSLAADWEAGKKYTYKLHIATDISFTVSVSGWGDAVAVPDGDDTDEDNDIEIF